VTNFLRGTARHRPRPVHPHVPVLQRHVQKTGDVSSYQGMVTYGPTGNEDTGTTMEFESWRGWTPGKGSKPTAKPGWWPSDSSAMAGDFFQRYMVQGHLLSEKLGGPGNTLANLVPLTKSANTMHERKLEQYVKGYVDSSNYVVDYHVYADHSRCPPAREMAPNESNSTQRHIDEFYGGLIPRGIAGEFTVWRWTGSKWTDHAGTRWKIGNEGKEIT
jgi:DNA/RNA non-specific endonuclease